MSLKAVLLYSCLVSLTVPSFVSHHHKKSASSHQPSSHSSPPHSSYQPSTTRQKHSYVFVPSKPKHVVLKNSQKSHPQKKTSYSVQKSFIPKNSSYRKSSHAPSRSYSHGRRLPSLHGYSKPSSFSHQSRHFSPISSSRDLPSIYASSPTYSTKHRSISSSQGKSSLRGDSFKSSRNPPSYYILMISDQTKRVVESMRERKKHQETKPYITLSSTITTSSSASTSASSSTSQTTTTASTSATTTKGEEQFNLEANSEYDDGVESDSEGRIEDADSTSDSEYDSDDDDAEYDANGSRDENVDYSDGNVDYNPDSDYFTK